MTQYEYQHISTDQYESYLEKAKKLLFSISRSQQIEKKNLSYHNIITYFQQHFNIRFVFFDADPAEDFNLDDAWPETKKGSQWIKYKNLVCDADFEFLPRDLVDRISGVTIPSGERTLIMINQDRPRTRVIFTILHELCHFYFHVLDQKKGQVFVSLVSDQVEGKYSQELIPFENEANNIASILFCPTEKLEYMIVNKCSFDDMCQITGMSTSAMHNRLLNYCEHVLHLTHSLALNYVFKLRHNNVGIYPAITYKINAIKQEEKLQEELMLQAAYRKKYKGNPYWQDIFDGVWLVSDEDENEYF